MDDLLNEREARILGRYREIYDRFKTGHAGMVALCWAYPVPPPIPFIGRSYGEDRRSGVLVYASAENLTNPGQADGLRGRSAMLRSRQAWRDNEGRHNVHIEPINNGGLLLIARHLVASVPHDGAFSDSPNDFLEQIAVANPGKFCIDPARFDKRVNKDYAGDWRKFEEQRDFILADLHELKPDILILPTTVLNSLKKAGIGPSLDDVKVIIGIRQVQAKAIFRKHDPRESTSSFQWGVPPAYLQWSAPSYAKTYLRWIEENKILFQTDQRVILL